MARAIDADNLAEGLKYHYQPTDQECDFDRQWAVGYNAGLNRALYSIAYARTIEPKQEWIRTKDRLPEQYAGVIAYDGDAVGEAFYDGEDFMWTENEDLVFATHWMPLPEPPKEGE